jgi:cobalt-zinc-cadmium efflux system outer membrane protein
MRITATILLSLLPFTGRGAAAAQQTPVLVTREAAIDSALARAARLGVARADTVVASAELRTARAWPNPVLATSYTKSTPRYHTTVDVPLPSPWLRSSRTASAQAGRTAAQYRLAFEVGAVALDADTSYTRAVASHARARLSRQNAADADSLRSLALIRREAGDASDLDVELATINAGQQANAATADSLGFEVALLNLQAAMGLAAEPLMITVGDSLGPPAPAERSEPGATSLRTAAAERSVAAAELAVRAERRAVIELPSVTAGFETGDPTGAEPGLLPVIGLSLPLPLFTRNAGPIARAEAERLRSEAELRQTRLEVQLQLSRATREREVALARVARDRTLLGSATRVAEMSLLAYHEGASTLPNVLEAQRAAREVRAQFIDDLASAWIAAAALRLLSLSPPAGP